MALKNIDKHSYISQDYSMQNEKIWQPTRTPNKTSQKADHPKDHQQKPPKTPSYTNSQTKTHRKAYAPNLPSLTWSYPNPIATAGGGGSSPVAASAAAKPMCQRWWVPPARAKLGGRIEVDWGVDIFLVV